MQGILIDSRTKEVRLVEAPSYDALKEMMGVRLWQVATYIEENLQLLVDEEGLFNEGNLPAFTYEGYPSTLVGCGMVMQTDEEGDAAPITLTTVEEVRKKVGFTTMLNSSREKILDTPPVIKSFDSYDDMQKALSGGSVFTQDSPSGGASPAFDFASELLGWKREKDGSQVNTAGLFEAGKNGGNLMDALNQFYKPPQKIGGSILARFKQFMESNSASLGDQDPHLIFVDESLYTNEKPSMVYGVIRPTGMGKERVSRVLGSFVIDLSDVNKLTNSQGPVQASADGRPFFLGEPFPTLWIECVTQPLFTILEGREKIEVHALYLWRSHEDNYLAIMFGEGTLRGTGMATIMSDAQPANDDSIYTNSAVHCFLFHLFQALARKGQLGTERMNERFRIGTGSERRQIKIKDIVHVRLRRKAASSAPTTEQVGDRKIEWSHRWEVMGHWRKVSGIGKDDRGRYHVQNYTWVIPHTKGPEEKDLVKKTRLIVTKKPGDELH
jgi:hypothetical protein